MMNATRGTMKPFQSFNRFTCIVTILAMNAACSSKETNDTGPIEASALEWTFVPVGGATCRDGTPTGIGVSLNPASTKVAIYLEGGGACFNEDTCNENPSHFDASNFANLTAGGGIDDRGEDENPIRDWNMFFIPYCTGDVHAGDNPDGGGANGVPSNQRFVGYE